MDVATFCRQSSAMIVAGKGGVGKTTVGAALARTAAHAGLDALLLELEGRRGLAAAFSSEEVLRYDEVVLHDTVAAGAPSPRATAATTGAPGGPAVAPGAPGRTSDRLGVGAQEELPRRGGRVRARTLTPDEALLEYLENHGMKRVSKRLASSGVLDVAATAIPGIKDILVLGKVKQLAREGSADLVVVDAPAAGHALSFLGSARGLLEAARAGPLRAQATEVDAMLTDPERCQVILVTLPEEMPVNEAIETAYQLEDRVGVHLGPIVVNGVYPDDDLLGIDPAEAAAQAGVSLGPGELEILAAAARFRTARHELQEREIARLAAELPLPQLRVPYVFSSEIGAPELETMAAALADGIARIVGPGAGSGERHDTPVGGGTSTPGAPTP